MYLNPAFFNQSWNLMRAASSLVEHRFYLLRLYFVFLRKVTIGD